MGLCAMHAAWAMLRACPHAHSDFHAACCSECRNPTPKPAVLPLVTACTVRSMQLGTDLATVWMRDPESPIRGAGRQPFVVLSQVRQALDLPASSVSDVVRRLKPRHHIEVGGCAPRAPWQLTAR